ncbi:DUF4097 family beta strand repeat-containing protein [Thalassotalea sp. ND16A]|uniref:DUF4097 family beta strand repeat-containing protein n=1 Tax=Thalassotalea sp. ND16A TaxID=1535422 RepID=UPI00051A7212|nr:DUF4097 family beta strand repeat-containing protein [Thalassotalea sp. ND16A]KGK00424.1 hypothetical protein ND16A_3501 [Thalassotalea sp. ND16A]
MTTLNSNFLRKAALAPALTFATLLAFNAQASIHDTVEKSFDMSGKGQLMLDNVNGDVTIESWDKKVVQVTADITAEDQEARDRVQIKMKQSGNRITVETDYEENHGGWGHNSGGGSVDYTIMVPANIDLREIDVVNGSLTVVNVSGELNADVVNGSVEASGLASDVEVESVNGAVELTFADSAKNIDIETETVNGSIRLHLPANFGAKVTAETGNGSIKTDYGIQGVKGRYYGNDMKGTIGDGSSDINLESVNGSIKLLKK